MHGNPTCNFRTPPRSPRARRSVGNAAFGLAAVALVAGLVSLWLAPAQDVSACGGSPPLVCGRSTALVKTVCTTFLAGFPVVVTVVCEVSIAASPPSVCAAPTSTTVDLSAVCTVPPDGVGSATIPTPTPGLYLVPVDIVFPAGPPRICTISGTATTSWADGAITTGTGDLQICFVPALNPTTRLFEMDAISGDVLRQCSGDQSRHCIRVRNNGATPLTFALSFENKQEGGLSTLAGPPLGSGANVMYVANPRRPNAGDAFDIRFPADEVPLTPGCNYVIDDGTRESTFTLGSSSLLWLNRFTVVPGAEIIDKICYVVGAGSNGKAVRVLLYSDPNGDGNPTDAVLLESRDAVAANAGTNVFNEVQIMPTSVGPPGTNFFAGVVMQMPGTAGPAARDTGSDAGRSWFVGGSAPCTLNVNSLGANTIPPTRITDVGLPGNWMIRANGLPSQPIACVPLAPDPPAQTVSTAAETILLCPGESRIIYVDVRSNPMCRTGSSCGLATIATEVPSGTLLGCVRPATTVDNVNCTSPQFQWPDGGISCDASLQGLALVFTGDMPTHQVRERFAMQSLQVLGQFGSLTPSFATPMIMEEGAEAGRLRAVATRGSPPLQVNEQFQVIAVYSLASKNPELFSLLEPSRMMLHHAEENIGPTYFYLSQGARLSGGGIPPTLDSFFDVFFSVSLDCIAAGTHRFALIDQGSISVSPLGSSQFQVMFNAMIPHEPGLPTLIDQLQLNSDAIGTATGLIPVPPNPCPCPGDINNDGIRDITDLGLFLAAFGLPPTNCADIDGNGVVDISDLGLFLAGFGVPCP